MITRQQYLSGHATFLEYYQEIAETAHVRLSAGLLARAKQSTDPHLNDIPLSAWDAAAIYHKRSIDKAMRDRGDFWSAAGGVCTVKAVARRKIAAEA